MFENFVHAYSRDTDYLLSERDKLQEFLNDTELYTRELYKEIMHDMREGIPVDDQKEQEYQELQEGLLLGKEKLDRLNKLISKIQVHRKQFEHELSKQKEESKSISENTQQERLESRIDELFSDRISALVDQKLEEKLQEFQQAQSCCHCCCKQNNEKS